GDPRTGFSKEEIKELGNGKCEIFSKFFETEMDVERINAVAEDVFSDANFTGSGTSASGGMGGDWGGTGV
ncbi:hypothetical protein LCGC14_2697050, partial [marine sediment metagenome]